jgi:hypothetical protein
MGYFGYKVLAFSEGGTLQFFGAKGATYGVALDTQNSGKSWVRLKGTIFGCDPTKGYSPCTGGDTSLTVATPVDWQDQDHVVVTTTDYLPNHSEELIICGAPTGNTIKFTALAGTCAAPIGVQWTHNGEPFMLLAGNPTGRTTAETRAAVGLLSRSFASSRKATRSARPLTAQPFLPLLHLIRLRAIILGAIRSCGKGPLPSRSKGSSFVSWGTAANSAIIPFTSISRGRRLPTLS